MKAVVGLGNPGTRYQGTRHNIGFQVLDEIARLWEQTFTRKIRFGSWIAQGKRDDSTFLLVKPATYMNRSGLAVAKILKYFHLSPSDVLVILDDVSLNVGEIRLREKGSSGGHKGLASIMEEGRSEDFPRLRIGILSEEVGQEDLANFVLSPIQNHEEAKIERAICFSEKLVDSFIRSDFSESKKCLNDCKSRGELD